MIEGYKHDPEAVNYSDEIRKGQIATYVNNRLDTYSNARERRQDIWLECWAAYLATPEAQDAMEGMQLETVGNVNTGWRHKITTGKAFELVETAVAFLWQATFPNRDWFDVIPQNGNLYEVAQIIKGFSQKKFEQANFMSSWNLFLRQMVITGVSVMALPWRTPQELELKGYTRNSTDKNGYNEFEVLDIFDCYTDPNATDPNKSDFVRRIIRTRSEVCEDIDSGYYKDITKLDVVKLSNYGGSGSTGESDKRSLKEYQGITVDLPYSWTDHVEVIEYWGDIHLNGTTYYNVQAVVIGEHLVRFEKNPFKCGKPFIIGTYTPLVRSNIATGILEPVLGMLHELNIVTNQRLDNLELSIDSMWELVKDGSIRAEDVYTAPGKVFSVEQLGSLQPIQNPQQYTIAYTEASVLEQRIDQSVGSIAPVNGGILRDSERVTATEIRETKNAGGNRFSSTHKHIETTSLQPLLSKVFESFQQFVRKPEIIRVSSSQPGFNDYIEVDPALFKSDVVLIPVGADHILDKDYKAKQLMGFLQATLPVPQFADKLDFDLLLKELARAFNLDNADRIIKQQEEMEIPQLQQADARQQLDRELFDMGGRPMQQHVDEQLQIDGGASLINELFDTNIPPIEEQIVAQ